MDMFVQDDEVVHLDAMKTTITPADLPAQLNRQLSLAWHLRQRDSQRAIELCHQILQKLRHASLPRPATILRPPSAYHR